MMSSHHASLMQDTSDIAQSALNIPDAIQKAQYRSAVAQSTAACRIASCFIPIYLSTRHDASAS